MMFVMDGTVEVERARREGKSGGAWGAGPGLSLTAGR